MIIELNDNHKNDILSYLKREPCYNIFLIGDIEIYGMKTEFMTLWAEYENGDIKGVLLKYYNSFVFYSIGECNFSGFAEIIETGNGEVVSGKKEVIERIIPLLDGYKVKNTYFAELKELKPFEITENIKIFEEKDVEGILELRSKIEEFNDFSATKESIIQNVKSKAGRIYCLSDKGKIVSSAGSTAENSTAAMIVSVCTLKEYRGNGYAAQIMSKLCSDLLSEGKRPCLFYNNPDAGKIYKKIGFEDMGFWTMLIKNK